KKSTWNSESVVECVMITNSAIIEVFSTLPSQHNRQILSFSNNDVRECVSDIE
ncbi:17790_t:CDS:1, partial [Gigaspora rosea]